MANNQANKNKAAANKAAADNQSSMTKADAAKLVKRKVVKTNDKGEAVLDKNGSPVLVEKAITEDDVHAFADYPEKVVVVTTAGEKLVYEK